MIVPVTMMHMHVVQMDLKKEATREKVLEIIEKHPRMGLVRKATGITSTAELKEYAMDLGRHRSDLWENGIFEESVSCLGKELYLFQAIHQEADVVVENIDCIRAMTGIEKDPVKSIAMTNKALNFTAIQ
jgi:glyceraldehyde-3-phosphate dehydrogenase (NAD(P))